MSGEKASSPCGKFQANIFNKSKCQNCFKSRELHLLRERDLEQAKPIYGGWLCLAPEGTDFDNPIQRSRKWQRRFFILYEDGSLSFALDELPSTLPQGTVSMTLCTDIADAEPRTGQRNALCLLAPEQEIFIRGDNKEIINGWSEQLVVYLQTNRLSQKKKRKVEPVASQEPSPAKISATNSGFPSSAVGRGEAGEQDGRPDETPVWTVTDPRGDPRPSDAAASTAGPTGSAEPRANGIRRPDRSSSAERLQGSEASRKDQAEDAAGSCRKGRSEACSSTREKLQSCGDASQLTAAPPPRRSKSLDRRTSDTIMTPDLLNFKKGWMVKLDEDDQWKKSWFVLSTDSLRYYRDSVAEEASDLEGELDLTKCFGVSEYQVQRNYGFQIHTQSGVFTLSAMTAGIRKNWIQALMKNVHPANAPDVTSSLGHHVSSRTPEVLPRPDVTQDSACTTTPAEPRPRSVADKRRDGRYRTFDWVEFRPQSEPMPTPPPDPPGSPHRPLELLDVERRRRREERRRRYENMLGISLGHQETGGDGGVQALRVEEEMEECWRLVEKIMFRPEKTIPLMTERRDSVETETMLHSYRQAVEDLKEQLAESQRCRLKLEAQLNAAGFYQQQLDRPDFCLSDSIKQQSLTESRGLVSPEQPEEPPSPPSPPQLPSIWLQDTQGNLLELQETPLLSPASDDQHRLNSDLQAHLDEDDLQQTEVQEVFDDSSHQVEVKRLSREVELLTGQNEALNQRNQEMLNQLTEADREIERLKAELSSRYTEPRLLPEAEQQEKSRLEDLEVELNLRNQELLEAQALVASLEDNLREAEALLQQAEDVEDGADKAEGYLLRCFEATEDKLTELETQLRQSKQENVQLKEAEQLHRRRASEAAADVRRLSEELEQERTRHGEGNRGVTGEEKIQQVMEAMAARRRALGRLLEVIDRPDFVTEEGSQLKREEQFWSLLLHKVKDPADQLLSEVTQQMMLERQMLLLLLDRDDFQDMVWSSQSVSAPQSERSAFALEKKQLQCVTQMKIFLLNRISSSVISSTRSSHLHQLQLAVDRLHDSCPPQQPPSTSVLHSAATEALYCCRLMELQSRPERHGRLVPASLDASCQTEEVEDEVEDEQEGKENKQKDMEDEQEEVENKQKDMEDEELEDEHKDMEDKQEEVEDEQKDMEDEQEEVEDEQKDMEDEQKDMEDEQKDMEDEQREVEDKQEDLQEVEPEVSRMETQQNFEECDERDPNVLVSELTEKLTELREDDQENLHVDQQENLQEVDQKVKQEVEPELSGMEALELDPNILISELTEQLTELQEQMSEVKQEFEAELRRLRTEHQKETDKLKATCERGLSSMEDAQAKVVVELQRRHQLEVERLLLERDRLLEEESTATATAIEAIKNAHRLELQRELERRERSSGGTHLDDVYRQHSEELASYQRELEVLSQQFCLKCLENGHLVQAVDAERKALCQCQQENQDLRTKNQELSGHLAAEITRLCSLAKQDALPLSQGMDLYEMEITLRVKESEVQCLKQEITSLKDEMQSVQKDKRNATKKYKDMYTELSIVRAKAQRDADELRENLRLAHQALGQSSP